jgi:hypothetical protein
LALAVSAFAALARSATLTTIGRVCVGVDARHTAASELSAPADSLSLADLVSIASHLILPKEIHARLGYTRRAATPLAVVALTGAAACATGEITLLLIQPLEGVAAQLWLAIGGVAPPATR